MKNTPWHIWVLLVLFTILVFKGITVNICLSGDSKEAMRIIHEIEGNSNHSHIKVDLHSS